MITTQTPASVVTDRGVTVLIGSKIFTAQPDHPNYSRILAALRDRQYDGLDVLFDLPKTIENAITDGGFSNHEFAVEGGIISLNGEPFTIAVSQKVLRMVEGGYPIEPLRAFLRKVRQNPSARVQSDLLLFAVANDFMIHEDGDVVAWKGITGDYLDCHSRTVPNKPASLLDGNEPFTLPAVTPEGVRVAIENGVTVVSMPRHSVDDRHNRTCSFGLHVGSFNYALGYGSRQIAVKVNPADFVSIPEEYGNGKARVCRYEILQEMVNREKPEAKEVYTNTDFGLNGNAATDEIPTVVPGQTFPIDDEPSSSRVFSDSVITDENDEEDDDLDLTDDEYDEERSDAIDDMIDELESALLHGKITSKAEFGEFVSQKGYKLSDEDVRKAITDAEFGRWLD